MSPVWKWVLVLFALASVILNIGLIVVHSGRTPRCAAQRGRALLAEHDARSGVFADLSPEEYLQVQKYMLRQKDLDISTKQTTKPSENFLFLIDLLLPPKAEVLAFLDGNGPQPERRATVVVFHGSTGFIKEYVVGPLPTPTYHRDVTREKYGMELPLTKRTVTVGEYVLMFQFFETEVFSKLQKVMAESFGVGPNRKLNAFEQMPRGVQSGDRKTWVSFFRDMSGMYIHPVGFEVLLNHQDLDPSRWSVERLLYNGVYFDSVEELNRAYDARSVERIVHKEAPDYGSLKPRPGVPLQVGPQQFSEGGKRFSVRGNHVVYLDWSFAFGLSALTGMRVFDVRFRSERILYELSVQEAMSVYGSVTPGMIVTKFLDSSIGIGRFAHELVRGVDCPYDATYVDSVRYIDTPRAVRFRNSICVFAQPPPAHHVAHHHQTPRAIPVPAQAAPPPRMVNLCQTNQTTIIAPNPMLQGALLMQQMQGNMRSFGMGGQQFRQFYAAGSRSSLLGPVPMGMAIKSPIMGFPAARPFHPHTRFFNPTTSASVISATDVAARYADRKRDSEQMAGGSTDDQPAAAAAASSTSEATDKSQADGSVASVEEQNSEEQFKEPLVKRQRTEGSEKPKIPSGGETATASQLELNSNTEEIPPEGSIQEDSGSSKGSDAADVPEDTIENQDFSCLSAKSPSGQPSEEDQKVNAPAEDHKDTSLASPASQEEDEEVVAEGSNKFYCYLCSITCHNQQNFRSHMNSISHQQRMMEIQYMSNACLVTLLPRVQESLQGANKDGDKKSESKRWCATCHSHFTCSTTEHRCSEEHKLATATNVSFCIVCKKQFKTSQNFLEHLHSQGHKQKLQEKGCDALVKLTALDTVEFSLENEEEGGGGGETETEGNQRDTQDDWSSLKEVTLNDISRDEQYDPDTVYGSSFLVPVAGFICKLCNKFYYFDSSAAHTHCKSLKHFENLRSYRESVIQKGEGSQSSRKSSAAADSGGTATQSSTDCSEEKLLSVEKDVAPNLNSLQSIISVNRPKEKQPAETDSNSQDLTISTLSSGSPDEAVCTQHRDEENTPYASAALESEADLPRSSTEKADSEPAAAAENSNDEDEAPAGPGKKNGTGKARTAPKRRSGRATNRR